MDKHKLRIKRGAYMQAIRLRSTDVIRYFSLLLTLFFASVCAAADDKVVSDADVKFEYAVKFVCGTPEYPVVAPGEYFTAINVHNPHHRPVRFRKKVAVALPAEKGGPISRFFNAGLAPDQALEIDCPDILRHANTQTRFLKGFVVVQSPLELDIVAVYTAAGKDRNVVTLDTERVPYRSIGAPQIVKADPEHCPAGGLGQAVGQEGCCCNKPRVYPPRSAADWWPDCSPGLTCVGNLPGPNLPTSTYSICTSQPNASITPPLHSSQPAYCGQR